MPRLFVLSGSIRSGSLNTKLAAAFASALAKLDADVTLISLSDYPMPLYDGDIEHGSGAPANADKLRGLLATHDGGFMASPEYNSGITPLLKNTLDWVSRSKVSGEPFKGKVFALGSASPGGYGGFRAQMGTRQILELGLGAIVIPQSVAVGSAHHAFDEAGHLKDERSAAMMADSAKMLVQTAAALRP